MKKLKILAITCSLVTLAMVAPALAGKGKLVAQESSQEVDSQGWKDFHSVSGKCTLKFPSQPEHISEKMSVPEEGYDLKYDAYVSTQDKKSIYMLLIAEYPPFVDQSLAQVSLEGFLNGILANNPSNQLLYADLLLVDGQQALDFFIRTGGVYFKGRAIMVKNQLYLMAMECEVQSYNEGSYNYFVTSFKFGK
jgi:hypothetical protein